MPAFDAKAAAAIIDSEIKKVESTSGPEFAAAFSVAPGTSAGFCAIWPKVKPILEMISGIAAFIPGVGSTAGAVLKGLLQIGDRIAKEACG